MGIVQRGHAANHFFADAGDHDHPQAKIKLTVIKPSCRCERMHSFQKYSSLAPSMLLASS
jgi:hypothetical protein